MTSPSVASRTAKLLVLAGFTIVATGAATLSLPARTAVPVASTSVAIAAAAVAAPAVLPAPVEQQPVMAPIDAAIVVAPAQAEQPASGGLMRVSLSSTSGAGPAMHLSFTELRARLHWVALPGQHALETLDAASRLLLAKSAADRAGLADVGLDFRDVYGVINAETSWVPRAGMGKNGRVSYGLAQFERATARAVGLTNPDDAVEAVHAAARHLKEAAVWSAHRIAGLNLSPDERARKLREGVSIYYNVSSRGRSLWSGTNTGQFPVETLRHIQNVMAGARQAERIAGGDPLPLPRVPEVAVAQAHDSAAPAAQQQPARQRAVEVASAGPKALGTIAWSHPADGGGKPGHRETYVVWSNGKVSAQGAKGGQGMLTFTPRG